MLPIIRLKTNCGTDIICVFRVVVSLPEAGEVHIYEHSEPNTDSHWIAESGVTLDDIQRAVNESIQGRGIGQVVATGPGRRLTPAEV